MLGGTLAMGGAVIGGIQVLGTALATLGGPVAWGAIAAIGGVVFAVTHWTDIMNFAKDKADWLRFGLVVLLDVGDAAIGMFKGLAAAIGGALGAVGEKVNGFLHGLNLPPLPDFSKMKMDAGVKEYTDKRLDAFFKGYNSNNLKKVSSDPRFSMPPPALAPKVPVDPRFFVPKPIQPAAAIPSKHAVINHSQNVTINQTNTNHIHTQQHHDVHHIAREVTRLQTLNNHHMTKAIPSGQGTYRSNFSAGDSRGNE